MIPIKRLKLEDKNMVEDYKVPDLEPPSILQHLDALPPEILEKIFQYLSPEHLVLIQNSCNSRVTESTALKKADFSDSKTANEALMDSFFTAIRTSSLQEIYLPQMIYIDGQINFKYISRCKFLTKLNICYRGLSYIKILHILEKCKALRELYYYVFLNSKANYGHYKTTHNLKKISLTIDHPFTKNIDICGDLLSRCDTEAEVYLNFSYGTTTFILKHGESKRLVSDIIISVLHEFAVEGPYFQTTFRKLISVNFSSEDFTHEKEGYRGFCVSFSKIYPIFSKSKTSCILPATPLHTLVLADSLNTDYELERNFFYNLTEEASLKSLKHLTVLKNFKGNLLDYDPIQQQMPSKLSLLVVPDILSKCSHLQEVVFSGVHFSENCTSLLGLKHIKTLTLPPCAMSHHNSASQHECPFLEELVENCKCIENFSIVRCSSADCPNDILTDDDLFHIHKWSNLKSLSISMVHKLRTCSFLPHVAANTKITALSLRDIGTPSVCHYSSNLCYAIKMAHNLKFLQINQQAFNPSQSIFWKNIAEVKTLEGICILSYHSGHLNSSMITNSLEKLKMLHLFHLRISVAPESLIKNIRKVILGNGIRNPNIEIESLYDINFGHCQFGHYPFIVPSYHHHL